MSSSVVVLHRSIPGPRSADPRDRQVYRRVLQLAAMGMEVTVLAGERLPEGGAPRSLLSAGVHVDPTYREPVPRRLALVDRAETALLVTTPLLMTRATREAVLSWAGPVVLDIDHLPTQERLLARDALSENEQPGIDTELKHLRQIEAELLDRAALVLVPNAAVAATIAVSTVVAPPEPTSRLPTAATARTRTVLPARFSDEWATPDETALGAAKRILESSDLATCLITPEDSAAMLRQTVRRLARSGISISGLSGAADASLSAMVALDLRPHGVPTHARRFELSGAGVPWVASTTALGVSSPAAATLEFGELANTFVSDSPDGQAEALRTLVAEEELREEVAKVQRSAMEGDIDVPPAQLLARALASVNVTGPERDDRASPVPTEALRSREYLAVPTEGTLAAADPCVEALEAEMVPVRLHDRDTSINLQSTLDADARYRVFARTHLEAGPAATPRQTPESRQVHLSVLVPTYDTDPALLEECIASVAAQQHTNWELCIVDDGSPGQAHHEVLRRWERRDERVKVRLNPWNQGIGLASNDALAMATGDWVVLLDHDDLLKPDALAWCARYITDCNGYDMWYSDEDKVLLDGQLGMPFFKPDWSPDFVRGVNYVCHLLCARAELLREIGGFRPGYDGAQDFDLVLRLTEEIARRGTSVGHIAKPLYSWRMIPGSTALATSEKPAAHHAGHRALEDSLVRRFEPATVVDGEYDTTHRIRYSVDTSQLLTIMIPTRDRVDLLANCIDRLRDTSGGVKHELLIVDNDSTDPATLDYLDELVADGHQVVRYPHEFSFARQVNLGALHARGDLLLILNNDTWARNDDWLLRMMEHAQRPEVGLVGAKLMFPEGMRGDRPQHEGIVMGMAGLAYNIDLGGYMGMDQFVRDTSAVTAACAMIRPAALLAVGGMEERLRVAYNDVDFGLRVGEFGYRVVYTPHSVLEHPESASRGTLHPSEDELWLIDRWGSKGDVREPFISPQLEWCMPVFYRL